MSIFLSSCFTRLVSIVVLVREAFNLDGLLAFGDYLVREFVKRSDAVAGLPTQGTFLEDEFVPQPGSHTSLHDHLEFPIKQSARKGVQFIILYLL